MKEQDTKSIAVSHSYEEEELNIDLMAYARQLWGARKWLLRLAALGLALGVVVALTTPKQYTVQVTLAPESSGGGSSSGLAGMAAMLGMGGGSMRADADALNVGIYPDLVSSTPFLLDLFAVPVTPLSSNKEEVAPTPLVEYLENQSGSPLAWVLSLPGKAVGGVLSLFKEKESEGETALNPFRLTQKQNQLVGALRNSILCNVDKKTGVTSVTVTMPDAQVAAQLTNVVVENLQQRITAYRTTKAQQDCDYLEQLCNERQAEYYAMQERYARYVDANMNVILQSALAERERLQNDMNLAFQIYSQVAQQLQMARAKVQEAKPAFAVVEPATVPINPSGTSRKMVVIGFIFLAVAAGSAWILFGRDFWATLKQGMQPEIPSEA
ncbi:MAG: Wzz/FepE/Etk N-terminal domain-containing protein [Phocaeicola sp.]